MNEAWRDSPRAARSDGMRGALPPAAPRTKVCRTCREEKPLRAFSHDGSQPDKHDAYCRQCRAEKHRAAFPRRRGTGPDAALVSAAEESARRGRADAMRRAAPFLLAEGGRWGALPFPAVDAEGRIWHGDAVLAR